MEKEEAPFFAGGEEFSGRQRARKREEAILTVQLTEGGRGGKWGFSPPPLQFSARLLRLRTRTRNRQGRKERLDKKSPRFKRWVILGQRIPLSLYFDRSPLSHIDGDLWNSAGERRKRKAFSFCFSFRLPGMLKSYFFCARHSVRSLLFPDCPLNLSQSIVNCRLP